MSGISHIGIAVKNLDEAVKVFRSILGCDPVAVEKVDDQKVEVAVFRPAGPGTAAIELICPTPDNVAVNNFIEKRGQGMHHLSLKVPDVAARLAELKKGGYRLIDEKPRPGAEGKTIAFVHPASTAGVLLELEQEE